MDKRTQIRLFTTLFCLGISLFALYAFLFVVPVSAGWRIFLVLIALSWIVSGILNLISYLKK